MKSIMNFISYWYFRYLLITELFMVEKWERYMFHIVLVITLSCLSLINTYIVLGGIGFITNALFQDSLPSLRNEL